MLSVRRCVATLVLVVAVGSGCGSDGDEAGGGGSAGPATSRTVGDTSAGGNSGGGGGSGGKVDACSLLTDQEAGAVLGGTVIGHGPGTGPGESVCEWEIQGDWSITVSVGTKGTAAGNTFKPDALFNAPEPVAELGQAGWYVGLNTVEFAAGERRNSVQVVSPDSSGDKRKAIDLAVKLKDRIR